MNTDAKSKQISQNILVTGGGGFLGSAIIKQLKLKQQKVRSFARGYYPKLADWDVEQIQGDIADYEAVKDACENIDLVFHVAAKPGVWGRYKEYYRTNTLGTENVIGACYHHHISRMIYTSSPSVVFDGESAEGINESAPYARRFKTHYSKTKALAEQKVIQASGELLRTIILRPHLIWGPEDNHLVPRIIARAKRLRKIGSGQNLVDTTYIDNAAQAHILAAEKLSENEGLSGNVYFISQGEPVPVWDMINAILKAAGLGPVKGAIPKSVAWSSGALLEVFYRIFNVSAEPPMTRFVAEELSTAHWFDITAAKRDLEYDPKVSIQEGLCRLEKWLQKGKPT
jgi:nucleoside-diphosphate-sugar epimerase